MKFVSRLIGDVKLWETINILPIDLLLYCIVDRYVKN